jgi:nickel superoxide dismutase
MMAAQTVKKMVEKIHDLKRPDVNDAQGMLNYHNSLIRMVSTKEEHSQLCKKELLILWTDYFKEEHLKMFPDLHTTFWNATKLCSKNKQEVSLEAAQLLEDAIHNIGHMWEEAEKAKK